MTEGLLEKIFRRPKIKARPNTEYGAYPKQLDRAGFIDALAKIKVGGALAEEGWNSFAGDGIGGHSREMAIDLSQKQGLLTREEAQTIMDVWSSMRRPPEELTQLRKDIDTQVEQLRVQQKDRK